MRRALRIVFRRAHIARAVDDEIAFHLEMRTQRLIASGLTLDAARREALRQFGNLDEVRQNCVTYDEERERAMRRRNVLDELQQDVAYAFRTLRRNAVFALIVVMTLALGIGANTAIFTLIDAVLLRPLDVSHPDQLVAIGDPTRTSSLSQGSARFDLFSYPLYREVRSRASIFGGVLATGRADRVDLRVDGHEPEHPRARYVSGNYFTMLGVPAARGRTFGELEDAGVGGSPVVVVSHAYWQRRFAGADIVGKRISINHVPLTVVGIAREGFGGVIVGAAYDVWLPLTMQPVLDPHRKLLDDWDTSWLLLLGRLAPGRTFEQAEASLTPILRQSLTDNAGHFKSQAPGAVLEIARTNPVFVSSGAKGFSRVRSTFHAPLLTLMAGVALLLLIVCGNVANLLLGRAVARGREIGVRLALGASRGRLVRQLLTESLVLSVAAAAGGLVIGWWGSRLLVALTTDGGGSLPLDLRLDLPVLGFTLLLSVAAVALFGVVPALRASRVDLATTMRTSTRTVGAGGGLIGARGQRIPVGKLLIVAQVALSVVLLVGAGLLVRSLRALESQDTGIDRDHLLIVDLDVSARGYSDARLSALVEDLSARLRRIPEVAAVSYSENGIFSGTESQTSISAQGFSARTPDDSSIYYDQVGPSYAHALGVRLLQGRDLSRADDAGAPVGALVNETAARFYFPGASAVGKWMKMDSTTLQVVGVVADVQDHDLRAPPVRRIYVPYLRPQGQPVAARFEVRTTGDPSRVARAVRQEVRAMDAELPIDGIDPLSALMRQSLRAERLVARLATAFGAGALLLAALGLYGVMTYAVTRRTGEMGLRAALGAQRGTLVGMVIRDALRLVVIGFAIGLPLAIMSVRLLASQLHGVGATDPLAIGGALSILTLIAVAAVIIPAVRAGRVEPSVALREE